MKLKLPWPIAAIVYRYALRVQTKTRAYQTCKYG